MADRFPPQGSDRLAETRHLLANLEDGRTKFYTLCQTLAFRNLRQALFREGRYVPLVATGERASHLIAFARLSKDDACLVVVPRMTAQLLGFPSEGLPVGDIWGETAVVLPKNMSLERLRNVFTAEQLSIRQGPAGPELRVRDILANFPAALLAMDS
jgi:(1->4)-alpha-D-glucan 1-alpha-D-glucosylmutase